MHETENSLIHSTRLVNEGLILYDRSYDRELINAFNPFLAEYEKTNGNPAEINLTSLKNLIESYTTGEIDLYIINEEGIIEYTTYKPDFLLDFSEWPDVYDKLTKIRNNDSYSSDRVVKGFTDSSLKKYAYMPTPDHKYILEIGLTSEDFNSNRHKFSYSAIAREIPKLRSIVKSVKYFDETAIESGDMRKGLVGVDYYPGFVPAPEQYTFINQTFVSKTDQTVSDPGNHTITHYIYINLDEGSEVSSSHMNLVSEIVYTTKNLDSAILFKLTVSLLFISFAVILALIIAYSIYRFITKPIDGIISDIEVIADGDYDHQIQPTQGIDLERLERSISIMVNLLNENIVHTQEQAKQIEEQSEELKIELSHRIEAENALLTANKKLSLLSGITRHDIKNQIAALRMFHAILQKKMEMDPKNEELMRNIDQVLSTIDDQISFTRDYEELGVRKPAWQNIEQIIQKIQKESRFSNLTITSSLGDLEILADQMLEKVFFNLFDNAIRHGISVTTLDVSYYRKDTSCTIVIQDNGIGIEINIKPEIFRQGYGSHTGFGLFLSREVLSITDIEIIETGKENQGARFEMIVPDGKWRCDRT